MRFTSAVLFLGLSVMAAAGLGIKQVQEATDTSVELVQSGTELATSNNRQGRQSEVCTFLYNLIKDQIPDALKPVISAIAILPDFILTVIFKIVLPGTQDYIVMAIQCWREITASAFGADPTAAKAELDGSILGNVFFAQTLEREGEPESLAVVGAFERLTPGQVYKLTVHKSGDISDRCAFVDSEYSDFGGAKFTADDEGKAVLLIQNRDVLLEGTASVLGRSVVVTPVGGGKPTCGVIARNIVNHRLI